MVSERKQKLALAVGEQVSRRGAGFSDYAGASQFREITTPEEACSLRIVKLKRGGEVDQADAKASAAPEGGGRSWRVSEGLPETAPICKEEVEILEMYLGPLLDQLLVKRQDS